MRITRKTHPNLLRLRELLTEIDDIKSASVLLYWDRVTYMPSGGSAARGRQLATLRHIAHTKFTSPVIGQLLEDLSSYEDTLPYDTYEASLIRITRRNYKRAVQVPAKFMANLSRHVTESYGAWAKARSDNDFAMVVPYLEKTLELSREYANFFGGYEHIADPLIEGMDYGMKAQSVRSLFAELRKELVPIVEIIGSQPIVDVSCLHQHYPEAEQIAFSLRVIEQLGYDLKRGRQDKTLHPFMAKISIDDLRITNRFKENKLDEGLFSTIHEMGHALYEQGINREFEATPLASGTSAGVHESQSRLWENIVGRSRPFWQFFYSQLQAMFPYQLQEVSLETFYKAINKVERSFIRTEADEITYNLHIMIRFDLELQLLEGKLAVQDLPEAWNERYKSDFGITPLHDSDGVLQDVHWYCNMSGANFPGYTLGNLMSCQFFEAAIKANPDIMAQIKIADFSTLHNWLKENIYQHGCKYTAPELVEKVTGSPLNNGAFIRYIQQKYGEIYNL